MTNDTGSSRMFNSEQEHDTVDRAYAVSPTGDEIAATCTYQGQEYQKGAEVCMGGSIYRCGNNGWFNTKKNC